MLKGNSASSKLKVVGAGLVGSLLSIYLARRGFEVEAFERRPDMRVETISAGRSINLAVSARGLFALREVGLEEEVLRQAVPMLGRMMHLPNGELAFQRYGVDDSQCINSISRGGLNKLLMTEAEKTGRVRIHFEQKVEGLGHFGESDVVFGTDGSASALRGDVLRLSGGEESREQLDYGYKELAIAPGPGGAFRLEKNALHIWPRGSFMLIALPNHDGSFTCTLFLPFKGAVSFETLASRSQVRGFFEEYFVDALSLIDELEETFFANPTGHMVTIKTNAWNYRGRALLLGDAAHAIVPFFGQGMNCGFEDCTALDALLDGLETWQDVFDRFTVLRKTNADAIADMAVENFIEMRDKVADPKFLLEKAVDRILLERFPHDYASRYALVTFSRVPYRAAYEIGQRASEVLAELCQNLSTPAQVDLAKAEALIKQKLSPQVKSLKT